MVIFGATSAIAQEIAVLYVRRGARLYLVGRSEKRLVALVSALEAVSGAPPEAGMGAAAAAAATRGTAVVGWKVADFTETGSSAQLVAESIAALGGGVDVAIIAHGFLGDQLATERDFGQAQDVIATNFLSVVALLIPLANHLETRAAGHLAVLSSVAAERGRPRNYTYGAAKGGLNVYLQGLRSRLGPRGVRVHTLKLGPVDTPMTVDHKKTVLFARAPRVASEIVQAIDRGRGEAYVPGFWRVIMLVVRCLPEALFRRVGALSRR